MHQERILGITEANNLLFIFILLTYLWRSYLLGSISNFQIIQQGSQYLQLYCFVINVKRYTNVGKQIYHVGYIRYTFNLYCLHIFLLQQPPVGYLFTFFFLFCSIVQLLVLYRLYPFHFCLTMTERIYICSMITFIMQG